MMRFFQSMARLTPASQQAEKIEIQKIFNEINSLKESNNPDDLLAALVKLDEIANNHVIFYDTARLNKLEIYSKLSKIEKTNSIK